MWRWGRKSGCGARPTPLGCGYPGRGAEGDGAAGCPGDGVEAHGGPEEVAGQALDPVRLIGAHHLIDPHGESRPLDFADLPSSQSLMGGG